MSAVDTAARVMAWAIAPVGPPPRGDLGAVHLLARPPSSLCAALSELTRVTAAKLRLASPTLGDEAPIKLGAIVLAAALGALDSSKISRALLRCVPPARTPGEWIARHGVMGPAREHFDRSSADGLHDLLLASPLTALLTSPAEGQQSVALDVAHRLIDDRWGRVSLALHLAEPTTSLARRRWRRELLDRLRLAGATRVSFVLDVYEAMMIHHHDRALHQIRDARSVFEEAAVSADDARLADALSAAAFWGPLAALERSRGDALRARRYLGYDYREGVALYRLSQRVLRSAA